MRMKIVPVLYLLIFFFLPFWQKVSGQEKNPYSVSCLKTIKCDNEASRCTLDISGLPAKPDTDIYIAECIGLEDGQVCTTGSADSAEELRWDGLLKLNRAGYTFVGLYDEKGNAINQPQKFTNNKEYVEWASTTLPGYLKTFIALYQPQNNSAKQTPICETVAKESKISVFDLKTLEPIEAAKLSLFQKIGAGYVPAENPGLKPDYVSGISGAFDIALPEGEFKIDISHPLYEKTSKSESISQNIEHIFPQYAATTSALITADKNGYGDMNIGLSPKAGTVGLNDIKIISLITSVDETSGDIHINGIASHPFSVIEAFSINNLEGIKSGPAIKTVTTDKTGKFSITISQAAGESGKSFGGITVSKSKYLNGETGSESRESTDVRIDPIPLNLAGYAFDKKGSPLVASRVGLKLPFAKTMLYETKTDESGYFSIGQPNVPPVPFVLEYDNGEASGGATIGQFITQNAAFIKLSAMDKKMFTPDVIYKKTASAGGDLDIGAARYTVLRPIDKNPYVFWSVVASIFALGIGSTVAGASLIKKSHHSHT